MFTLIEHKTKAFTSSGCFGNFAIVLYCIVLYGNVKIDIKNADTGFTVVATTFLNLKVLIKRCPGCYMNKIKIKSTMTINVLEFE